jgi:ABC-type multidrug transport system ATPase subunit
MNLETGFNLTLKKTQFSLPFKTVFNINLDNLFEKIKAGEIIGIYGFNGAGKTEFIKIVLEDLKSQRTTILEPNKEVRIGYLPQDPCGLVLPWLKGHKLKNLFNANFDKFNCDNEFELKLNTPCRKLSFGERQILGLYLILSHKFNVIILDEPCSALDNEVTKRVMKLIKEYCSKNHAICFLIEHDLLNLQFISNHLLLFNKSKSEIILKKYIQQISEEDFQNYKINAALYSECQKLI